jgi:hypothetical protein
MPANPKCSDDCAPPCPSDRVEFNCFGGICVKKNLVFTVGVGGNCNDSVAIPIAWNGSVWTGTKTFSDQAGGQRTWKATASLACSGFACTGWTLTLEETAFTPGNCPSGGISGGTCATNSCTWCPVNEACGAFTAYNYCQLSIMCVNASLTFVLTE